jgi:hypothetical protein
MQRVVSEDEHCRHSLLGGSRSLQSPVAAWLSRLSEESDIFKWFCEKIKKCHCNSKLYFSVQK